MGYSVYKHTAPNGKVYIGITKQKPQKRWAGGYYNNEYFQRAINKYGWNNFKHEILFVDLTKEAATKKEIELIAFYKSANREFGYNISSGGEAHNGCKHSKEFRQKLSELYKCKLFAKTVYQYSLAGDLIKVWACAREAERELKINHVSECCRGERKTIGGYVWSYTPLSEVKINYLRKRNIKIIQYDLQNNFIKEWSSVREIKETLNLNHSHIISCCNNKRKTSYGYIWQYK